MKHFPTETERPLCTTIEDKMFVFDLADPTKGEEVNCPRCLKIKEFYEEENIE